MGRLILPSVYWGNIEYFARLVAAEEAVIDLGEHYIKRSERNRTAIMTANGVMSLSVPLVRANRPQTPVTDLRIDYSTRWQHRHWTAIVSAYRSSPYFEMVADRIEHLYTERTDGLVEYNCAIFEAVCSLAKLRVAPRFSQEYIHASAGDIDLRPKHRPCSIVTPPYFQLFSDRMPFEPNLSILDLLMCDLTGTASYLRGI
jgi:hypothetical protein